MSPRRKTDEPFSAAANERDSIRRGFLGLALAHELKQPLHSLNLNIELLNKRLARARPDEVPDVEGPMAALGRVVDRINDCIDVFAARVMPETPAGDAVAVPPILRGAVDRAKDRARRAEVKITVQTASDLPPIPANTGQLATALDALLDNAIRASRPGGDIVVSSTHADDEVRIEVSDRGIGMSSEVARRAVEIGFSTWESTGIGLTVAKFITYHHGGAFQVNSTPGQGTTVTMTLPISEVME